MRRVSGSPKPSSTVIVRNYCDNPTTLMQRDAFAFPSSIPPSFFKPPQLSQTTAKMREFGVELSPNIFSPNGYRLQLSEAERAQIFSLRRANVPVAKIADDFHVSRQTVYRVFEEVQDRDSYAQKPRPRSEKVPERPSSPPGYYSRQEEPSHPMERPLPA